MSTNGSGPASAQAPDYSGASLKKMRGRPKGSKSKKSRDLIAIMHKIAEAAKPISVRGIAYKLFTAGLIPSMGRNETNRVSRLLTDAREDGTIPWSWLVDETRSLEGWRTWVDPEEYARREARSYCRDFWALQPVTVEVWSEKGTVRGVLAPVLEKYLVPFQAIHGFSSATAVHKAANSADDRPLHVLYVGDFDPSGMRMSEVDLPGRLAEYGGHHIEFERIALTGEHVGDLPSFPAADKGPTPTSKGDSNYKWFVGRYGDRCWELDAMDPNDLRACVEEAIKELIDPVAWEHCEQINEAEQASLKEVLERWSWDAEDWEAHDGAA